MNKKIKQWAEEQGNSDLSKKVVLSPQQVEPETGEGDVDSDIQDEISSQLDLPVLSRKRK